MYLSNWMLQGSSMIIKHHGQKYDSISVTQMNFSKLCAFVKAYTMDFAWSSLWDGG